MIRNLFTFLITSSIPTRGNYCFSFPCSLKFTPWKNAIQGIFIMWYDRFCYYIDFVLWYCCHIRGIQSEYFLLLFVLDLPHWRETSGIVEAGRWTLKCHFSGTSIHPSTFDLTQQRRLLLLLCKMQWRVLTYHSLYQQLVYQELMESSQKCKLHRKF